jgi:hypothetical protein
MIGRPMISAFSRLRYRFCVFKSDSGDRQLIPANFT